MNPLLITDFYKVGHVFQYPKNTQFVYSNLTPRKSRLPGIDHMVFFGLQYFIQEYLVNYFQEHFFSKPLQEVMDSYRRIVKNSLGSDLASYDHIEALHNLGYLPIRIKALPEGSRVPMRVPCLTICNTEPEFYWLTNFFETWLSSMIWQPCTSATLAYQYRKQMNLHAEETGVPKEFVQWQGHDFSFRGMSSLESAILSGMGHLLSFTGTDTIPAIMALEKYYGADSDNELIGGSVPATEHSVMCSGSKDCEIDTIRRLITEVYPTGIVSIVSDTWDLWKVLTEYLPALKTEIMSRDGKVVARPDSGDPVDILCGTLPSPDGEWYFVPKRGGVPEYGKQTSDFGVIELLWNVFGGKTNEKGFKMLDPHVGAIYGDSITLERENDIYERLKAKGFASQVVLGIGSYTYQYNTRDTFGLAMKATYVQIDGKGRAIFKTPVTDDGTKNSATGLLRVESDFTLKENVTEEEEMGGALQTVFEDGVVMRQQNLKGIRKLLWG